MVLSFSPVDLIIFSGVIQGLFLGVLCYFKRKHKSHWYLTLFLIILSVQLFLSSQPGLSLLRNYPITLLLLDSLPFLLSPLLYFYVYYSFYRDYEPRFPVIYHLIPGIANCLFMAALYLINGKNSFTAHVIDVLQGNPPLFITLVVFLKIFSGLLYVSLIGKMIINFKKELKEWTEDRKKRRWFTWLITSFSTTWLVILVLGILSNTLEQTSERIIIYTVVQTVLFVWLIYMITGFALSYPALFEYRKVRDKIKNKLNLSDIQINKLMSDLKQLMEVEEAFTDPDISLSSLASELKTHENILSFIINEKSPGNFSSFINSYRIDKFISLAMMMDPATDTFLTLAYTSGFNSKSSFNRIFKTAKEMTPSQYLKKIKK